MSKYNARKTEIDGFVFDSQAEGRRYSELRLLEKAGEVVDLELQPKYKIVIRGKDICTYIADFRYSLKRPGGYVEVVEDVKGFRTAVYRLKKKLVEATYVIEITEVTA
jgi:hypothetical protein